MAADREPLQPTPYTLHPTPNTLHPAPYTLHPTPYALHPTPYTLHPSINTLMGLTGCECSHQTGLSGSFNCGLALVSLVPFQREVGGTRGVKRLRFRDQGLGFGIFGLGTITPPLPPPAEREPELKPEACNLNSQLIILTLHSEPSRVRPFSVAAVRENRIPQTLHLDHRSLNPDSRSETRDPISPLPGATRG